MLRTAEYKDADKMLTLFSKDMGKVSALARGAKKGKLKNVAQILFCGEFALSFKNGKCYVSQAESKMSYFSITKDFDRFAAASAMLEATELFLTFEPAPKLFALLTHCLLRLKNGEDGVATLTYFFIKLMCLEGFEPQVETCVSCGSQDILFFSAELGGALCIDCANNPDGKLTPEVIQIFKTAKLFPPGKYDFSGFSNESIKRAVNFALHFVEVQAERCLKSARILIS